MIDARSRQATGAASDSSPSRQIEALASSVFISEMHMTDILTAGRKAHVTSTWVDILRGRITAAGAPSGGKLARWARAGASDVVTLLREDEMRPGLPAQCADLGLAWHHLPLSGRRLNRRSDRASIQRIPELVDLLRRGGSVVVHCAAGLHRTGVCLYLVFRASGQTPEESAALIRRARPLTANELVRKTRKSGVLVETAERLFQPLAAG